VVEFHFADFLFTGGGTRQPDHEDPVHGGGQARSPSSCAVRMAARSAAAHHSQRIETLFKHIPGIKVAIPSTPADVYGLYRDGPHAIDPVIFFGTGCCIP